VSAAEKTHAVAVIYRDVRPGSMLTHAEPVSFSAGDTAYHIPVLDIADEHQKLIERLLEDGGTVRLRLNVQNHFLPGPVETVNVSGEIKGSEHPEMVVVLGAHLDSWDLGTGAIDDGTGVAAVLGAAEAIKVSGVKPRRTIRVVLFTGEEQGLLGSRAWVKQHAAEVSNLVCALVLDWGQGSISALPAAGHDELKADLAPLAEFAERDSEVSPGRWLFDIYRRVRVYVDRRAGSRVLPGIARLHAGRPFGSEHLR
jgi:carboxypeptidase Q